MDRASAARASAAIDGADHQRSVTESRRQHATGFRHAGLAASFASRQGESSGVIAMQQMEISNADYRNAGAKADTDSGQ
jgi:hypothetical protein